MIVWDFTDFMHREDTFIKVAILLPFLAIMGVICCLATQARRRPAAIVGTISSSVALAFVAVVIWDLVHRDYFWYAMPVLVTISLASSIMVFKKVDYPARLPSRVVCVGLVALVMAFALAAGVAIVTDFHETPPFTLFGASSFALAVIMGASPALHAQSQRNDGAMAAQELAARKGGRRPTTSTRTRARMPPTTRGRTLLP